MDGQGADYLDFRRNIDVVYGVGDATSANGVACGSTSSFGEKPIVFSKKAF